MASRFTVLRDGESVGGGEIVGASLDAIIQMMVGREMSEIYPRTDREFGETVLELKQVAGLAKPTNVSLRLCAGEILGVFGLVGAGRTETLRTVFGLDRLAKGSVAVIGHKDTHSSPAKRLAKRDFITNGNRIGCWSRRRLAKRPSTPSAPRATR